MPKDPRPYRPCAGLMLINAAGLVFVGQRLDSSGPYWQMPQGGIDAGETPVVAALRELREETGIDQVRVLAESTCWRRYDLPPTLSRTLWGGAYRGQTQKWFLLLFEGADADIHLDNAHPEFSDWRWIAPDALPEVIVPFKRDIYAAVLAEFRPFIPFFAAGGR